MVALSLRDDAVVAGEAGGLLRDHAEAGRVMVAAGDERGARRRAERRGVELRVAQPGLGDAVQRRRRNDAAEGARRAEADVVGHDQQHVRRALGRHDARRPPGLRLAGVVLDHAAELRVGRRELLAVDGRGRPRRSGRGGLLREGRQGCRQSEKDRATRRFRSSSSSPCVLKRRGLDRPHAMCRRRSLFERLSRPDSFTSESSRTVALM